MPVLRNIRLLATCAPAGGQGDVHPIPAAALAWDGDRIGWVGPERDLPARWADSEAEDAGNLLVVPGLVDCHTHLAFGGWRTGEFVERIRGTGYLEMASRGGGIQETVRATRSLPTEALLKRADGHLQAMLRLGVTTVEAKSGYGLSLEHELRLLDVYRQLGREDRPRVIPTLLAAHAVPPEFAADRAGYIRLVIDEIIPAVAARGLARFCDVFVEQGAFSVDEARQILTAGSRHGMRPKLHAEQLSETDGAGLAAELGAVSADHLEKVTDAGIRRLAEAGVVAVSLPFASLYLGLAPMPARKLIEARVPVAVATDFNPGSAPSFHLPMAMTLACTTQRMTPAEVLKGVTLVAAQALGMESEVGSLEVGKRADFALIEAEDVAHWLYHLRGNACAGTVLRGRWVWQRDGNAGGGD